MALRWRSYCHGPVISVSATPNCSRIVAASADCNVQLLGPHGQVVWRRQLVLEGWAAAISRDASVIAAGSASKNPALGALQVFDRDGREILRAEHETPVWGVAVSPDGSTVVCTTWGNDAFRYERTGGRYVEKDRIHCGKSGLYGVSISEESGQVLISGFQEGLYFWRGAQTADQRPLQSPSYGVHLSRDGRALAAGLMDGRLFYGRRSGNDWDFRLSVPLAQAPVCGVALSQAGRLVAIGSFDGRAYLVTDSMDPLWSFETEGEVWSTTVSDDGLKVLVGSGDHGVYMLDNACGEAAYEEIAAAEQHLEALNPRVRADNLAPLREAYAQLGLAEYAIRRLRRSIPKKYEHKLADALDYVIRTSLDSPLSASEAHIELAHLAMDRNRWRQAIEHLQMAARDDRFRLRALTEAAKYFEAQGWHAAALSCHHRARENELSNTEKLAIFNLARDYEDAARYSDAAKLYELLTAHDINFRTAFNKVRIIRRVAVEQRTNPNAVELRSREVHKVDYTGRTVSTLGLVIPRKNVEDPKIQHVVKARHDELSVKDEEREAFSQAAPVYASFQKRWDEANEGSTRRDHEVVSEGAAPASGSFPNHATPPASQPPAHPTASGGPSVRYESQMLWKYDSLSPEDEVKKRLELLNALTELLRMPGPLDSLDIGAATGRYPNLLQSLEPSPCSSRRRLVVGLDKSPDAVRYARNKSLADADSADLLPVYVQGDGARLPFKTEQFDVVTCMMGTIAHFSPKDRALLAKEVFRTLRPGGKYIVSTWDPQSPHLSLLSMYGQRVQHSIGSGSPRRRDLEHELVFAGFPQPRSRPFAVLPNSLCSELDWDILTPENVTRLWEADLAFRSTSRGVHGQMYLISAEKPDTPS